MRQLLGFHDVLLGFSPCFGMEDRAPQDIFSLTFPCSCHVEQYRDGTLLMTAPCVEHATLIVALSALA
jgi:hypothetical protein